MFHCGNKRAGFNRVRLELFFICIQVQTHQHPYERKYFFELLQFKLTHINLFFACVFSVYSIYLQCRKFGYKKCIRRRIPTSAVRRLNIFMNYLLNLLYFNIYSAKNLYIRNFNSRKLYCTSNECITVSTVKS